MFGRSWNGRKSDRSFAGNRPGSQRFVPTRPMPPPWWRESYGAPPDSRHGASAPWLVTAPGPAEVIGASAPMISLELPVSDRPTSPRQNQLSPVEAGVRLQTPADSDERLRIDDLIAGQRFNRKLVMFDACRFDEYQSSLICWIRWGDGEIDLGSMLQRDKELWVCGAHEYSHPGVYEVRVTLSDGVSQAVTKTVWLRVAEPIPCPLEEPLKLRGLEAVAAAGCESHLALAELESSAPRWLPDWTSVIDWGDGSSSGGHLLPGLRGGTRIVGCHRYLYPGRFPTRVVLADSHGRLAHTTGLVWVAG